MQHALFTGVLVLWGGISGYLHVVLCVLGRGVACERCSCAGSDGRPSVILPEYSWCFFHYALSSPFIAMCTNICALPRRSLTVHLLSPCAPTYAGKALPARRPRAAPGDRRGHAPVLREAGAHRVQAAAGAGAALLPVFSHGARAAAGPSDGVREGVRE